MRRHSRRTAVGNPAGIGGGVNTGRGGVATTRPPESLPGLRPWSNRTDAGFAFLGIFGPTFRVFSGQVYQLFGCFSCFRPGLSAYRSWAPPESQTLQPSDMRCAPTVFLLAVGAGFVAVQRVSKKAKRSERVRKKMSDAGPADPAVSRPSPPRVFECGWWTVTLMVAGWSKLLVGMVSLSVMGCWGGPPCLGVQRIGVWLGGNGFRIARSMAQAWGCMARSIGMGCMDLA